jgi:hypothetical protein
MHRYLQAIKAPYLEQKIPLAHDYVDSPTYRLELYSHHPCFGQIHIY